MKLQIKRHQFKQHFVRETQKFRSPNMYVAEYLSRSESCW